MAKKFEISSSYEPAGDQPEAIRQLVEGIQSGRAEEIVEELKDLYILSTK